MQGKRGEDERGLGGGKLLGERKKGKKEKKIGIWQPRAPGSPTVDRPSDHGEGGTHLGEGANVSEASGNYKRGRDAPERLGRTVSSTGMRKRDRQRPSPIDGGRKHEQCTGIGKGVKTKAEAERAPARGYKRGQTDRGKRAMKVQ